MKPAQIVSLFDTLETDKATIKDTLDQIAKFVTPNKNAVNTINSPGTSATIGRYDSTGEHAAKILAGSIQGAMTPITSKWHTFTFRDEELNDDNEVEDWIFDCVDRMHKAFRASNFYTKSHEAVIDVVSYGTMALLQEELPKDEFGQFGGLKFETFGIREYVILLGDHDQVIGIIRVFRFTASQIRDKLEGKPGFVGLSDNIRKALNSDDPREMNKKFKVLHAIVERDFMEPNKKTAVAMPYASQYIAYDEKFLMSEGGYLEFPMAVARWEKQSDDNGWGRSPAWVALPEILTLNNVRQQGLKGLAKDISPAILVPHKGMVGGLRVSPNAINTYRDDKAPPQYFTSGNRWDITQFKEEDLKMQINKTFFVDQLQLPENTEMTATEASIRVQMIQRLIGPTFHRLTDEFYNPVVTRTFNIMLRAGAFLPVPDAIKNRADPNGDKTFDIEYTGPLARAQRQDEIVSIQTTYQMGALIAQTRGGDTSALDNLDDDEAMRLAAEQSGLPAKILKSRDDVQAMREQRAQAAQQQADMAQAQEQAELENAQNQSSV